MDQDEGMTKPQNAHLRSASQRSFSSVRVPFSTICPFGGLSCWVQSLAVKVQVSSTPTVSRHAFTLFAFEPVTSTNQISSAKTASKASAEMQLSADSNKNTSSFDDKPSSTFQLVVASVDWKSKAISNLGYNQHTSSCASLLAACANCLNSHESSCASRLAVPAQCLKSHETSCIFHLVARAKCHNKSNVFRLIVGFIQKLFQSQLQQDLVDLSLPNAFSIAKLDSIRIKANANMQITRQEAVPHFNVSYLYELIVDSKDPNHSRLIVDLFSNPYWEGVEYIQNVSCNKL